MRTTLIIPDPIGRRAKAFAKRRRQTLSQFVSAAVEAQLVRVTPNANAAKWALAAVEFAQLSAQDT